MRTLFWSNTIWYIALGAISVAMLVNALLKSPNRKKTFAFFFAVLGMTYFIEMVLLIVTDAYAYYPKIASDSFHESLIGNFFSQYSVTSAAVLIAVLDLNIWWRIGFSIAYFLIDVLFVKLSIYTHNWYSSWLTLAGFFTYSWVVMIWHNKIMNNPSKVIYYITLFLAIFSLYGNAFSTTLNFLEIRRLTLGLCDPVTKDNTASSILYGIIGIAIMIPIVRLKLHIIIISVIFLFLFWVDYFLYINGIIHVKAGWFAASTLFTLLGRYFITGLLDRSLGSASISNN